MPWRAASSTASARRSRSLVGDADDADRHAVAGDQHGRAARRSSIGLERRLDVALKHSPRSSNRRWLPDDRPDAADDRLGAAARAAPGSRSSPGSAASSRSARSTIARPIGCSDRASSDAASAQNPSVRRAVQRERRRLHVETSLSSGSRSCRTRRSVTGASRSRCAPPLISTPFRAAAASADTIDTGVEITSAHGHEMTSSTSAR